MCLTYQDRYNISLMSNKIYHNIEVLYILLISKQTLKAFRYRIKDIIQPKFGWKQKCHLTENETSHHQR